MEEWRIEREEAKLVCGVDEVGRGCLAGPVVACAVVMKEGPPVEGVRDSKKLTAKRRESLNDSIRKSALAIGFGVVEPKVIDEINIRQATRLAMKEAVNNLVDREGHSIVPDLVLVDAETVDLPVKQRAILHGDDVCYEIACASIVAKVYRDAMFAELDRRYPGYHLAQNKGYGTKAHVEGLYRLGATEIHRKSFLTKIMARKP